MIIKITNDNKIKDMSSLIKEIEHIHNGVGVIKLIELCHNKEKGCYTFFYHSSINTDLMLDDKFRIAVFRVK